MKRAFPMGKVYQLLEPGPVVMVTTAYRGEEDVMTMSWHMMIDFEPPILGFVMSEDNYSFKLLKGSGECVINIPTAQMAQKVVKVGNTTGRKVDKFEKFDLKRERGSMVGAALLEECYASLECRVIDEKMARKYNIFIVEVVKAWVRKSGRPKTLHHCGNGVFVVDGKVLKLVSKKK